jgi:hypothetical protein
VGQVVGGNKENEGINNSEKYRFKSPTSFVHTHTSKITYMAYTDVRPSLSAEKDNLTCKDCGMEITSKGRLLQHRYAIHNELEFVHKIFLIDAFAGVTTLNARSVVRYSLIKKVWAFISNVVKCENKSLLFVHADANVCRKNQESKKTQSMELGNVSSEKTGKKSRRKSSRSPKRGKR